MVKKVEIFRQHWGDCKGQALITLLVFVVIGISVITMTAEVIMVNSIAGARQQQGELAFQIADSGAENALLRVLRTPPPAYTGETLSVGTGQSTITITGSGTTADPYVIVSKGQVGNYLRQVEIRTRYQNNLLEVLSKKEIY